ncbi:MAG: hypothetical protein ACO31Z_09040 [Litorivicinaceae bacterium]
MSDDLVKRLRVAYKSTDTEGKTYTVRYNPDGPEAADRIEELEAKLAKAVEALEKLHRRQDCLETFDAVVNEIAETALAELKGEK